MALTFQGTKVSDITVVTVDGTETELTELYQGTTKVWGKRSFTLTLVNPSYMTVNYSYKDAGGYTKSGTVSKTTTFSNIGYEESITITATPKTAIDQYTYYVSTTGGTYSPTQATSLTITGSRATNKYTVNFSGTYGSWSPTSIANVPYGTAITRSGNTVSIGSIGTATFTPNTTTVQYNYGDVTYTAPASSGASTTISAVTARTDRVYTIKWLNYDGTTLETDTNVAYQGILTYNSSTTPSRASSEQYTYTFSGWKFGSTTVTSGTTKNPGSTSTTTLEIIPQFTATERSYAVTFTNPKYGTWNKSSITALYSTAISIASAADRQTATVTVGSETAILTANTETDQWKYYVYEPSGIETTVGTGKTYSGASGREERKYDVIFTGTNGSWSNADTINALYSTAITISGTSVTVGSAVARVWTANDVDYYSKTGKVAPSTTPSTVGTGKTFTGSAVYTPYQYTIQNKTVTGGQVYWSASAITTSGGSTTLTAAYNSTVYWRIAADTGYNLPTTYYGSMTLNDTNFTISSTTAAGNGTYKGSAIGNCTRKSYTITLAGPNYGRWLNDSTVVTTMTAYYGDKISTYGTSVKCYEWDATSTTRWGVVATESDTTEQYSYTTPTITGGTIESVTSDTTITATNDRTLRSYSLTLASTYGYWKNSAGTTVTSTVAANYGTTVSVSNNVLTVGSATYTFYASSTTAQYNYTFKAITGAPTSIKGTITVTGTAERSNRLYTIKWLGQDGSTVLETDTNVAYGAVLTYNSTTPTKASTTQYSYSFDAWKLGSTSGSTVTSGTTTNTGSTSSTTINIYSTFKQTERSYNITFSGTNGSWNSSTTISALYSAVITVSGTSVTVGSDTRTWSATAKNYYSASASISPNTSTTVGTGKSFTGSASYAAYNYTIQSYPRTGGTVTWSTSSSGTYTSTLTAAYGTTVYWKITANTGYDAPATSSGSMTLNDTNFTISSTTAAGNATYKGSAINNCTIKSFTITWKYLSAYPDTWTTTTQSYNYGTTPSRTDAATVTNSASTERKVFNKWNNLDVVTAARTITAAYDLEYNVTFTNTYSTASLTNGWYKNGTAVTWTAKSSYSFAGSAVGDTKNTTISASGAQVCNPSYVKCGITVGTHNTKFTVNGTDYTSNQTLLLQTGTSIVWTPTTSYSYSNTTSTSTGSTGSSTVALSTTSYSKTPTYCWITVNAATGCSVTTNKTGWYTISSKYTTTWTVTDSAKYTFNSTKTTSTTTSTGAGEWTADQPKTIAAPTVYIRQYTITVSSGTGCTANKTSGTYDYGTVITWTSSTGYAFDSAGTSTATSTVTSATTYTKTPGYVYLTLSPTNCTRSSGSAAGWYAKSSNVSTVFGANSGWSYASGATRTATETQSASSIQTPTTLTSSPAYCYGEVTYTNCTGGRTTKQYALPGTFTVTANTNYRFTATSNTTTGTWSNGCSLTFSPTYGYVTVNAVTGSSVSENGTGWYLIGSDYTSTYTISNAAKYTFSSTKTTSTTTTTKGWTASAGGTITAPTVYIRQYLITTEAPTGITVSPSVTTETAYDYGTIISWTGGTNASQDTSYSFSATKYNDYTARTTTVTKAGNYQLSDAGASSYIWYAANVVEDTHCTTSYSITPDSGWYRAGTRVTWTVNSSTETTTSRYRFANNSTTYSVTINTAGRDYASTGLQEQYNVTISVPTNTTCTAASGAQWLASGTTVTWTANEGYSFNSTTYTSDRSVSKSVSATTAGTTLSPGTLYSYYKITIVVPTHSNCDKYAGDQWVLSNSSLTITWTAQDYYSFNSSTYNSNRTVTKTVSSSDAGTTVSPGTIYEYGKVIYQAKCSGEIKASQNAYVRAGDTATSSTKYSTTSFTLSGTVYIKGTSESVTVVGSQDNTVTTTYAYSGLQNSCVVTYSGTKLTVINTYSASKSFKVTYYYRTTSGGTGSNTWSGTVSGYNVLSKTITGISTITSASLVLT